MKHLFVSYELALALKEAGFDEPCLRTSWDFDITDKVNIGLPLYQQVTDWLRERGKSVIVKHYPSGKFSFEVLAFRGAAGWERVSTNTETYYTYYEALNNAIKYAIKG